MVALFCLWLGAIEVFPPIPVCAFFLSVFLSISVSESQEAAAFGSSGWTGRRFSARSIGAVVGERERRVDVNLNGASDLELDKGWNWILIIKHEIFYV